MVRKIAMETMGLLEGVINDDVEKKKKRMNADKRIASAEWETSVRYTIESRR